MFVRISSNSLRFLAWTSTRIYWWSISNASRHFNFS